MAAAGLLIVAAVAAVVNSLPTEDGSGRLPALGWNSWNEYGCDINETVFVTVAENINSLGLRKLGYEYVNIDDCWSDKVKNRDNVTKEIIPDYAKFPEGIAGTAKKVHDLGLKIGIYSDAGEVIPIFNIV